MVRQGGKAWKASAALACKRIPELVKSDGGTLHVMATANRYLKDDMSGMRIWV
jgi:hypothetical protein